MHRSQTRPLCRCCGKSNGKWTETHFVRDPHTTTPIRPGEIVGDLRSKADCQRHANTAVVSVRYWHDGRVSHFSTWDGESWVDPFFCGGPCRDRFAYVMARAGHCTKAYNDALQSEAAD